LRHDGFHFTVTDLGRFLGKSPVTLRKWEAQGFVAYPRDDRGDRKLGLSDVAAVARTAREAKRISACRLALVLSALEALAAVEKENS
jgi:hypothetical protein